MDAESAWRLGMAWGKKRPALCTALRMTPEDIGGEAVVVWLESGRVGPTAWIDQIRRYTGRQGSDRQAGLARTFVVLDEPLGDSQMSRADRLADPSDEYAAADDRLECDDHITKLARTDPRMAKILLYVAAGWKGSEIADALGVSEQVVWSAVFLHRRRIKRRAA